jgi:hypothetical protein
MGKKRCMGEALTIQERQSLEKREIFGENAKECARDS